MGNVKTTMEIPDRLFRQAKAAAAQEGQSLKEFFTEAVRRQLQRRAAESTANHPWRKAFGGLQDLHRETRRVEHIIEEEFETIDAEDWR